MRGAAVAGQALDVFEGDVLLDGAGGVGGFGSVPWRRIEPAGGGSNRSNGAEFDFTLGWAPGPRNDVSVFTAIQEVGLRLTAEKGPVDTLVIDGVVRPAEN